MRTSWKLRTALNKASSLKHLQGFHNVPIAFGCLSGAMASMMLTAMLKVGQADGNRVDHTANEAQLVLKRADTRSATHTSHARTRKATLRRLLQAKLISH